MAYLGNTPTTQSFISGTDYFNGTGSQTAFTLTRTVNSVNDVEVVVNNVIQQPSSYTVSGTTLTLSTAPSSGTSNVYARYLSTTTQVIAPSQGTVSTASIADGAVTAIKMGANGTWAPTGTVIQVVQSTSSATIYTTSTSFVATGLITSITPKFANSKILVMLNGGALTYDSGDTMQVVYYRQIASAGYSFLVNGEQITFAANSYGYPHSMSYLDSPATTSTVYYQPYFKSVGGTGIYFNYQPRFGVVSLTLMEIAG